MDMVNHKCSICGEPRPDFRATCLDPDCHETYVRLMEKECGQDKIVEDMTTGKRYLVPTRFIIEHGLKVNELPLFPLVNNEQ